MWFMKNPAIRVDSARPGIWRYADHLPIRDEHHIVSLGEGQTPLARSARLGMGNGPLCPVFQGGGDESYWFL